MMKPDTGYTVTVTFTVHAHSDPHLQGAQAVKEEFESWLESLKATVHSVTVRPATEDEGASPMTGSVRHE